MNASVSDDDGSSYVIEIHPFVRENSSTDMGPIIAWRHPLLALVLSSVCLLTVAGNCLVVLAVCTKRYLRNPTGYLIISLACADLIVGLVVMPLNSLFEMTRHVWLLGLGMCDFFHAMDILASTSSIWNLCVISLDRYMAGRDPIGYRDKVSTTRIMAAIFGVWLMSACLSFPAIIWWRTSSPHLYEDQYQCRFTDSSMYVTFSALVSFYVPLFLILFAYGKVFVIATRHSRSLRSGVKKMKPSKNGKKADSESGGNGSEEPTPMLRIHIGRPKGTASTRSSVRAPTGNSSPSLSHVNISNRLHKQVSCRSLVDRNPEQSPLLRPESSNSYSLHTLNTFGVSRAGSKRTNGCPLPKPSKVPAAPPPTPPVEPPSSPHPTVQRTHSTSSVGTHESCSSIANLAAAAASGVVATAGVKKKVGVREKSRQMMRYVHEQRAARTLSIVVGAFIISWTPFFFFAPLLTLCSTVSALSRVKNNVVQCFAGSQETIFTVVTWAGHLNSMLNPLIYSRFSRDFRRAFKQLLTCQRERKVKAAIKTPLSLVFAQLISITQFWEQPQPQSIDE